MAAVVFLTVHTHVLRDNGDMWRQVRPGGTDGNQLRWVRTGTDRRQVGTGRDWKGQVQTNEDRNRKVRTGRDR